MQVLDDLIRPIGEIAFNSGAISGPNRDTALIIQERAAAFHAAKPDAARTYFRESLKNLANDNAWKMVKMLNGVTEQNETAGQTIVRAGKGVPEGVPPLGQIVSAMGFVSRDSVEALLAIQAGALTHKLIEDAIAGKPFREPAKPREGDQQFLQNAQELARAAWLKAKEIQVLKPEDRVLAGAMASDLKKAADQVLLNGASRLEQSAQLKGAVQTEAGGLRSEYGSVTSAGAMESSGANNLVKLAGAVKANVATRQTEQQASVSVPSVPHDIKASQAVGF